jgi:beta-galactosidase
MPDPFLHELYDSLNYSPQQRKFRRLRPWPVGVVFIEWPGMTLEDIRGHFRLMKELGFTCLKQCQTLETTDKRKVMHMALDEGIIPWWYDEAGWEDPTPEKLTELGIDQQIAPEELRANSIWLARQEQVMRERIDSEAVDLHLTAAAPGDGLPGTLPRAEYGIDQEAAPIFAEWLKQKYETVEGLMEAWNLKHCMVKNRAHWQSWEEVESEVADFVNRELQEYRRMADVFRFKADKHLELLSVRRDESLKIDPNAPVRAGGEMGLFLPFASRSTDMEGIADLMRDGGSFYPSFHPSWHFAEVQFEFPRPIYMQAAQAVDWFKGGWAASWEATGGPQALSGGKSLFVEEMRKEVAGFTIDGDTIRQLMLSWIAAGFRGFGQWCWNGRSFGWEGGEYALLDRNGRPCERTIAAGKIGQACRRLRDELWQARREPLVGVFQDFECDSFWAALAIHGRDMYKSWGISGRIGAARALINANIPFEHVTAKNLHAGLAGRYRSILFPACLAVDEALLELLYDYVKEGGRVVIDAPGAWYNYQGRLHSTNDGTPFEKLFGCRIGDYQYSRSNHRPWKIEGQMVRGFTLDLQPTSAEAIETFDDGRPSVTEHQLGEGTAIVIGYEASLMCKQPGDTWAEERLARFARGRHEPPYSCDEAIVYRLSAPAADHYFFINDGDAVSARLKTEIEYSSAEDPVEQQPLEIGAPVKIPAHSARWIRFT